MKTVDLLCVGEPLWEFAAQSGDASVYRLGYGGDTSNCAIAASRLGAKAAYFSSVGEDRFGRDLRALWDEFGVDHRAVSTHPSAPTGGYFIHYGPKGHEFSYARVGSAASVLGARDCPSDLIAKSRVVHASGISQAISSCACDLVFACFDAARSHDALVSYDVNHRPRLWSKARARGVIAESIAQADVAFISDDEAELLFGFSNAEVAIDWALRQGAKRVALKMGSQGAWAADASSRHFIPAFKVNAVDASGAGDCFAGAFLARVCAGDSLLEAGRFACAAAALSTLHQGATPKVTRAAVDDLMLRTIS